MASACRRENSAALDRAAVHEYVAAATCTRILPKSANCACPRTCWWRATADLTQFVRFTDRAWHAGQSSYNGRAACNDFSIGVELEGADTLDYEAAQYDTLAAVVAALCDAYPRLSADRVVGHSDISPGRKTDPGPAFDWERARRCIGAACREPRAAQEPALR